MNFSEKQSLPASVLAASGIVFGDIGTSPLYTLRECLSILPAQGVSTFAVMGFLSLIFWALMLVVTFKYVCFVMRADLDGEGGILTLMSLARQSMGANTGKLILLSGLAGGAFFYGDGVITPAISVISAIEGVEIVSPHLGHYIVPLALFILTLLFLIQKQGTEKVSKVFGPVMFIWFLTIGLTGVRSIAQHPEVLQALNPAYAVDFLVSHKGVAFAALGMVVLAITGAEALYADMGHMGKTPIRLAWITIALPALILNYFGQGALVIAHPAALNNPFFNLAPGWAQIPLIILSTLATVIAAQSVISGVYTLTHQAIRQGFLPPMRIIFTSDTQSGQIYIPVINWLLFGLVTIIVLVFQHSSALSTAYGIVVTGTMILTALLTGIVAFHHWKWPAACAGVLLVLMLIIDVPLFAANLTKLFSGGWLPVTLAFAIMGLMLIWSSERQRLKRRLKDDPDRLLALVKSLEASPPSRVEGTAIFLTGKESEIPKALLHNLKHNRVLHRRIVLLHIRTADTPRVHNQRRITLNQLSPSFWQITAAYGWCEVPCMKEILHLCGLVGFGCILNEASFFTTHDTLMMKERRGFQRVCGSIFRFCQRNALRPHEQFNIPPNRVIELGGLREF